jgi:regulator of sigma E protease
MTVNYILPFVFVLTVLVFVHEMGHYLVARWRGVAVEVFSVGFGPEIAGWTDSSGTRWKISWVPLGGYVKFFGDAGVASGQAEERAMTPAEQARSFHHKPLGSRAAVVAAGPAANFLFAILLLAGLYMTVGQPFSPPVIAGVEPGTVAADAGFMDGDRLVKVDGHAIERFEDLQQIVLTNPGQEMIFVVERSSESVVIAATLGSRVLTDGRGNEQEVGYLGVRSGGYEDIRHGPTAALWYASRQTAFITTQTLVVLGRMITGRTSPDELRGPIGIAQLSGQVAEFGIAAVVEFLALLSISLGLINLFPVPILDGGHLLYFGIEFVRGRPLGQRAQEIGFRIGMVLLLMLMIVATRNDVARIIANLNDVARF